MKAIIGIDSAERYRPALSLFARLRFAGAEALLLHSIESMVPDGSFPECRPDHPLAAAMRERREGGDQMLSTTRDELKAYGIPAETCITQGDPFHRLIAVADEWDADLIVAGSAQKPRWESLFFGSVSKGLVASSRQSLLIGKKQPREGSGLTAVLATDHSPYADKCIDTLIRAQPGGLEHITVVTAVDPRIDPSLMLIEDVPSNPEEAQAMATDRFSEDNERVRDRLLRICPGVETKVMREHTADAIRIAMAETDADLLIVGAHGHGFIERMALGSVSFHQVVGTPHNVLVVRPA